MSPDFPALEINLFGVPQLRLNGQIIKTMRRKNRALVYYLAAHDQPLTREHLLAFFWPDRERSHAQAILRTMIHDLRKHLGDAFYADDESLSLESQALIDVRDFSAILPAGTSDVKALAKILAIYKGDFLEGFSLADTVQFDEWAGSERDRYRLAAMRGFTSLAHGQEQLHDYPAALESMQHALAFNPFQEDLQREVMRLLYLNGDRAGVIRQYEALRKLLDEEMGVPPMPQTRDLYSAIISDTFQPAPPKLVQPAQVPPAALKSLLPFMGREAELETLNRSLGSGKLILIEREPGIGKTRLVAELIAGRAQEHRPVLVLPGVAHELEQNLPYQPILEALRSLFARAEWNSLFLQMQLKPVWLTEMARLLPELITQAPQIPVPSQPADESRLWEALLQFFRALSERSEIWLFLDDLHWADTATVGWLGYFVRQLSSPGLVVISTSRPMGEQTNLAKLVRTLRREDELLHLRLSLLPPTVMRKMAAALSPKHAAQLYAWLHENAEGNPFFLTELVRYAYEIGLLKRDGTLDTDLVQVSPVVPTTIQNLVEARLLRLSEHARQVLHLAAIIGRKFEFELVQRAGFLPEVDALEAIEELESAHLIRSIEGDRFAFDHSLTMQVALQDMNLARQHLFHRQVAEALESIHEDQLDPVSGLIAHHFIDGKLPERAAVYAVRAGHLAANLGAWVEAIAFYEQALTLEKDEAKRTPVYLAMGTAHFHKGDFALATGDFQTVVKLSQVSHDWSLLEDAHLGLNLSLIPQARYAEAIALAKELRTSGPLELALCAELIWGTGLSVESAHPIEAETHLRAAERLLQQQPGYSGQITFAQIKYQLAAVIGQQGRSLEAIDLYRQALDMIERGQAKLDILRNIMLYNNLAYHLHLVGDPSAVDYINEGIRLAQERGSLSHLPYLYSTSGEIALGYKDLDRAETYFKDGLALAEKIPVPERIAGLKANLGLVARERGQAGLAVELLQAALNLAQQLGSHHLEVRIRIWLAPLLPPAEARACLEAGHILAEMDGLQSLLEEIVQLRRTLPLSNAIP